MSVYFASTDEEKEQIYKLRYEVYIEELKKNHIFHDKEKKWIIDEFDEESMLLYTKSAGVINGAIRLIILNESYLKKWISYFNVPADFVNDVDLKKIAFVDRFVVAKEFRNDTLGLELMKEVYQFGLKNHDINYCFITAEKKMLLKYYRFGFRAYDSFYVNKDKIRFRLLLLTKDFNYLKQIRSPFTKCFDESDCDELLSIETGIKYFKLLINTEINDLIISY